MDEIGNTFMARAILQERCAWAVPSTEAIEAIAALQMPVIEIGAGNGYWAWMLEQVGITVAAFDSAITDARNHWCVCDHWTTVRRGGPAMLKKPQFADHALMLCWPPYDSKMACNCLTAYKGDTLIYVGESEGGCTGDQRFHRQLPGTDWDDDYEDSTERISEWVEERYVHLPQWPGLHDDMVIYRRKERNDV